jgi:hypothetical protein
MALDLVEVHRRGDAVGHVGRFQDVDGTAPVILTTSRSPPAWTFPRAKNVMLAQSVERLMRKQTLSVINLNY